MGKRYRVEEIVMKLRGVKLSMNMGMHAGRQEFQSKVIITKVNITHDNLNFSVHLKSQQ
jgi:hypothetical protein